jgi:hypothetical protein
MVSWTTVAATALSLSVLLPLPAAASSQGSMGASSTGSVTITASVSARAQISGLGDMAFAGPGAATPARAHDLCVWSNALSQPYTLVATGSGPSGSFELSNGQASIGYTVEWSGEPSLGRSTTATLQAAASESECLAGRGSIGLVIALEPARLPSAGSPAPYTGVLRLTVSPQ